MRNSLIAVTLLCITLVVSACSTSNINVYPADNGTGNISINVEQPHKGWDSVIPLDGVQANIPLQGGTVSNPINNK